MSLRLIIRIFWHTILTFVANNCFQMAAALSYYALLSMAPLILIALMVAGFWWDEAAASDALIEEMNKLMGTAVADVVRTILGNAGQSDKALTAGITGLVTLVIGATAVFLSLQDAMNGIWRVENRPNRRVWSFLRRRIVSTAMMGCIGLVLIVSLLASTIFTAAQALLQGKWAGELLPWQALNYGLSFLTSCALFAIIYKILPDVLLQWRDVFWSALGAGTLFTLGKSAMGSYLTNWQLGHTYGAASSVVVFLLWIYYSSLILFFGAQFTRTRLLEMNKEILPAPHARWITPPANTEALDSQ